MTLTRGKLWFSIEVGGSTIDAAWIAIETGDRHDPVCVELVDAPRASATIFGWFSGGELGALQDGLDGGRSLHLEVRSGPLAFTGLLREVGARRA